MIVSEIVQQEVLDITKVVECVKTINTAIRTQCIRPGGHWEKQMFEHNRACHAPEHYHMLQWDRFYSVWEYAGGVSPDSDRLFQPDEVVVYYEDIDVLRRALASMQGLIDVCPLRYMALGKLVTPFEQTQGHVEQVLKM